jgi:nucleoside-diphosphate-sugar epimerase
MVAKIAGKRIGKRYDVTKPQGVRGRNSDNTRLREVLKWEPQISLEEGLTRTYSWIESQLAAARHVKAEQHVSAVPAVSV